MGLQRVGHDWEAELNCTLETIPKLFIKRESCSVISNSLQPHRLYSPCNSPGENTGVDSHSLFQGSSQARDQTELSCICRQILYQPSRQGSPRILEWVAYPFSSESSWPRNWTGFFYIASGFFTNWASRETPLKLEFTRKLLLQETGFTGHFLSAYLQNHSTIQ